MEFDDEDILYILNHINVLIEGRFDIEQRDITLSLRGSKNQNIIHLQ
jgi:anaerobic ribonucleoside-triphosphate reductase activating protein